MTWQRYPNQTAAGGAALCKPRIRIWDVSEPALCESDTSDLNFLSFTASLARWRLNEDSTVQSSTNQAESGRVRKSEVCEKQSLNFHMSLIGVGSYLAQSVLSQPSWLFDSWFSFLFRLSDQWLHLKMSKWICCHSTLSLHDDDQTFRASSFSTRSV